MTKQMPAVHRIRVANGLTRALAMAAASSRLEWCSQFARTRTICNSGTERLALFSVGACVVPPFGAGPCAASMGAGAEGRKGHATAAISTGYLRPKWRSSDVLASALLRASRKTLTGLADKEG